MPASLPPHRLHIELERRPAAVILRLDGELDAGTAEQLERCLGRVPQPCPLVVLDLRELTFLDSSGLRVMLALHSSQQEQGGRLVLVQGPRRVHRVLELTRADDELEIVSDPGEIDPRRDVSAGAG